MQMLEVPKPNYNNINSTSTIQFIINYIDIGTFFLMF
jgi:hypothetical protein